MSERPPIPPDVFAILSARIQELAERYINMAIAMKDAGIDGVDAVGLETVNTLLGRIETSQRAIQTKVDRLITDKKYRISGNLDSSIKAGFSGTPQKLLDLPGIRTTSPEELAEAEKQTAENQRAVEDAKTKAVPSRRIRLPAQSKQEVVDKLKDVKKPNIPKKGTG